MQYWLVFLPFIVSMGIYRTTDGVTNPKYKLLRFLTTIFCQELKVVAFNQDRCCHQVPCSQLILLYLKSMWRHSRRQWQRRSLLPVANRRLRRIDAFQRVDTKSTVAARNVFVANVVDNVDRWVGFSTRFVEVSMSQNVFFFFAAGGRTK
jgi:hypothetical protein